MEMGGKKFKNFVRVDYKIIAFEVKQKEVFCPT